MNRVRFNFIVDALALFTFVLMVSTGFILEFVLPPGSGRIVGMGTGWRAQSKLISVLLGWTRHEWGTIHFWLALAFLAILSMHLFLHWRWVVSVIRKQPKEGSGARWVAGLLAFLLLLLFSVGPFISHVEKIPRSELQERLSPALK